MRVRIFGGGRISSDVATSRGDIILLVIFLLHPTQNSNSCFYIPETQGVTLENMAHAFGEASSHSVKSDGSHSHPHGEILSSVSLPSEMTDTTNTTVV